MLKLCKFFLITVVASLLMSGIAFGEKSKKPLKQDPELVISVEEVEALVEKGPEEGNYILVDARPDIKFQAGHIPTAISIPKPFLEKQYQCYFLPHLFFS